ncbi:MAG: hypothetical protein B6241_03560 [Spirochaetaceae bacterium 4572_59]|nr:MAG: hypothetical protein B6241_03560 [Spirochaetaceae bacterium 4572_59]
MNGMNSFNDLELSRIKTRKTMQATTFDLDKPAKVHLLKAGANDVLFDVKGKGYISNLWLTFPGWFWQHWNESADVDQSILKDMIIRIYWDGASNPAVESPVGDLFGNGLNEISNFTSKYHGMSSGGFFLKFPMPFRTGFKITVENLHNTFDADLFMNVLYQLDDNLPEDAGYFHTRFKTSRLENIADVPMGEFEGKGQYVGCNLAMQGEQRGYMFFLEAPEYIWVDGEEDAGIKGTGLEDYFLGGWYFREGMFQGPLHGVTAKDPLNASIAMYRLHEADAVSFEEDFKMAFVNPFKEWSKERLKPFCYSSLIFGYLYKPDGPGKQIPSREELQLWYRVKNIDHQSIP